MSSRSPRKRRTKTRIILGAAIAVTLGASGIYIASADAAETRAPAQLQAESWAAQSGAQTENTADTGGGKNVGWLSNGDWMEYTNVTVAGPDLTARIAAQNPTGGSIELHLGTQNGALLATFPVADTGNWQKWTTVPARATSVPAGPQTVFAVMKSASHSDFVNINYFTLGTGASAAPTTAAPAPTTAAPSPTSTGTTVPSSWVPVDQAAWQKELTEFNAIVPAAVTAGTTRVPEFHTDCTVANEAPDDPIVFPGKSGASHMHTFFGPTVNANSTPASLLASTKTGCNSPGDNSAYWVPQLQHNGAPVPIKSMRVYYGSRVKDPSTVKPFPPGLVMVQGDAKRQVATPKGASGQFWCAGSAETGRSADGNWPVCAPGGNLIFQLVFQDCWDGKNIDSPDHKLHMGSPVNGVCTGDYPVAIPDLSFMVNYDSLGGDGLALSSGMASSMHGDFMMGWDPKSLGALVKTCIDQSAKCGITPGFVGG